MKTLAVALTIFSLLIAPKVLAQDSQAPFHSQAIFHSQGDEHKSEAGEDHDKEAWDLEELDGEDDLVETPIPTATETPVETPTATPTVSPTPAVTATPKVQELEENQLNEHTGGLLGQISDLLKQILAFLESTNSKI